MFSYGAVNETVCLGMGAVNETVCCVAALANVFLCHVKNWWCLWTVTRL